MFGVWEQSDRDKHEGNSARTVLMMSLTTGVDEPVLLEESIFGDVDSYGEAFTLAISIRKLGR